MKYINYGFLLGSIILAFVGLYFWLAQSQIDFAAFFFALAALGHSVYVHSTKAEKSSSVRSRAKAPSSHQAG